MEGRCLLPPACHGASLRATSGKLRTRECRRAGRRSRRGHHVLAGSENVSNHATGPLLTSSKGRGGAASG